MASYWLFVVLMLATFTANLAAFLTVERMQSPVQSLDQLSRQSRINYTVVKNSDTHQYFRNMKNAEDKLYELWKNATLSSTSGEAQYRYIHNAFLTATLAGFSLKILIPNGLLKRKGVPNNKNIQKPQMTKLNVAFSSAESGIIR